MNDRQDIPSVEHPGSAEYLREALGRAGLSGRDIDSVSSEELTGGRTGASLTRLSAEGKGGRQRFVLKILPGEGWRDEALGGAPGGEAALWMSGVTRRLPQGVTCPTIDVSRRADDGAWCTLMHDVSDMIRGRGLFLDADERRLLRNIARLHAHYWQHADLPRLPLATLAGTTRIWAEPLVALNGGSSRIEQAPSWVRHFLQDFQPMGFLLPPFLDLLGPVDADLYLKLAADLSWLELLAEHPATLVHGDLRRANIAFQEDGAVCLFDWEFAATAPASTDLAWHWFLHFWAYPPDDLPPSARDPLLAYYLDNLDEELGKPIDRDAFFRAWELSWLRILVQLGFCLADAVDDSDPSSRKRVALRCAHALGWAREICERHGIG